MNTRFSSGVIVIPIGQHYPEGALSVDGYDAGGNLLAHPLGGGFQFVIAQEKAAKLRIVSEAERDANLYRRCKFTLEGCDDEFQGWTDGQCWNGWAMPRFERTEAEHVARAFAARYDEGRDTFITTSEEGEEEVWAAETNFVSDGTSIRVYPIGAGSWIWDEVE